LAGKDGKRRGENLTERGQIALLWKDVWIKLDWNN